MKNLRRSVVELFGVHRADQAHVVDDFAQMRQHFGQLRPALPVFLET